MFEGTVPVSSTQWPEGIIKIPQERLQYRRKHLLSHKFAMNSSIWHDKLALENLTLVFILW